MTESGSLLRPTNFDDLSYDDHKHRAKVAINTRDILNMLNVPEGTKVINIWVTIDPNALWISFTHPDLPESDDNAESNFRGSPVIFQKSIFVEEDGNTVRYSRPLFEWDF